MLSGPGPVLFGSPPKDSTDGTIRFYPTQTGKATSRGWTADDPSAMFLLRIPRVPQRVASGEAEVFQSLFHYPLTPFRIISIDTTTRTTCVALRNTKVEILVNTNLPMNIPINDGIRSTAVYTRMLRVIM